MEARCFTCPWAMVRAMEPHVQMHRRVSDSGVSLADYVGGPPTEAAYDLFDIFDREIPKARAALREEATGG